MANDTEHKISDHMTNKQLGERVREILVAARIAEEKDLLIDPHWLVLMLTFAPQK